MNQDIMRQTGFARVMTVMLAIGAVLLASSLPAMAAETGSAAKNLALICLNGKCGYINTQGKMVIPPRFVKADTFSANGLAWVQEEENEKYGYINAKGEWVIPPKFEGVGEEDDKIGYFTDNGLALVRQGGKFGYINAKGQWVIPPKFDWGGSFSANGLAWVQEKEGGKVGYINAEGKWVISPRFEAAEPFNRNGLAAAWENGKWGYINDKGKWVVSPRFGASDGIFINGVAAIWENNKLGYFNVQQGEWVIPPTLDKEDVEFERKLYFTVNPNALAPFKENGKYGYVNAKDELVISPKFDWTWYFSANGLAQVKENDKWGYINVKGEIVVYIEKICGFEVLKNAQDEITWPKKTAEQICEEQKKAR